MKRFLLSALTMLALFCGSQHADAQIGQKQRLEDHLSYLASDELQGRKAGSANAREAAEYIRNQYRQMGLSPFYEDWYQDFTVDGTSYRNVVAYIEGSSRWDEYIVIGAHYDHLGVKRGEVYNGADDNASGSSALIEVARQLSERRDELKCSVIIAAFDAEELGLYGSRELCSALQEEGLKINMMISVDMVGWYAKNGALEVEGVKTLADGKAIIESEAYRSGITVRTKDFEDSVFTATDTEYFAKAGIPTLAVTTGTKSPYHKPGDDADLIDYEGLDKITGFLTRFAIRAASDEYITGSGKFARKHVENDSMVRFKGGLRLGAGTSALSFKEAGFNGKPAATVSFGATARLDWKHTGIRGSVLIENNNALLPDPHDYLFSKSKYTQSAITVPVELLYQMAGVIYVGAGAYYSHPMYAKGIDFGETNPNQWGVSLSLGFTIGHVDVEVSGRSAVSRHLIPGIPEQGETLPRVPICRLGATEFGLIYNF